MAVTRINNNQISDASAGNAFVGINAGTKIQPYSITATKIANNLTYGSDLTITGNLTVQGNTTAIDTTFTTIEDPIILLASNQTGAPSVDIGFVGERGTSNNIAFVWDESSSEFVTVFTASGETNTTVSISSYANFHTNDANVGGNIVINGTTSLVGNLTSNVNITGNLAAGNVSTNGLVNAIGNVTGGNLNTGGQVAATGNVAGGNVNATSNVTGTGAVFSGNVTAQNFIGNISGNIDAGGANTNIQFNDGDILGGSAALTFDKTSNAVVASGNITAGNVSAGAGIISTTGNINGGNVNATSGVTATTVAATGNVSGGNINTAGQVAATGNVSGGNVTTAGITSTGSLTASTTISATGNVSGGNVTAGSGIISTTGNIDGGNVNATTVTATGNVSGGNVTTAGQVAATGNVSGGNVTTAGNITGGNLITAGITSTGSLTASTTINATGNVSGGNVTTAGQVVATGNITGGNLITTGTFQAASISSTGNITGGNLITTGITSTGSLTATTTISANGNVSGGNLTTTGITSTGSLTATTTINATGNITGGNLITTGDTRTGTLETTGNALIGGNLIVQGNLTYININDLRVEDPIIILGTGPNGAPLTTDDGLDRGIFMEYYETGLGNAFVGFKNSSGNMVIANNAYFTANDVVGINSYGTLEAGNLYIQSALSTGNVAGGNITTAGQVAATGNVTGGNLITTGITSTGSLTATTTISATGNVTGGNISTSGNITASFYFGNGSQLTGVAANTSGFPVTAGSSNIAAAANGNIGVSVAATSNVLTIASTGIFTTGVSSVTGNITGGNIDTSGQVVATGNVTGGNLVTAGITSTGSLTATTTVSATGNVTGGNVTTTGITSTGSLTASTTISATGNVSGGNLTTGGTVNATGNINGTGAVFSGNITAQNFIGNISGNIDAGGANTNIQFNDGDILGGSAALTFDKTSNAVVASGNITAGNVLTGGQVVATGNITGGNLITAGIASVTGNVNGGNLVTVGQVVATGNVNGGNVVATALVTGANVTATSNVTGANVVGTTSGKFGNIVISGDDITDTNGRVNFNTAGGDVDFAVNGDTVANVFYVDAGTGTASFGNSIQTTNAIVAFNATNSIVIPVGNTAQRPATGVVGMLRFNSTNSGVEVYNSSEWIEVGSPTFTLISDQQFNGDGATVAFTLSAASTTNSAIVSINGVVQIPTIAYSVGGVGSTTLTFTEAPQTGDLIDVRVLTTTSQIVSISNSPGTAVVAPDPTLGNVNITGNLVPVANNTQSLGSPTLRWTELYVSGNTITMGNVVMKNVAGGNSIGFFGPDGSTPATIAPTSVDTTTIANGTSNVSVASSGGNVRVNVGGTSNVMVVSSTGANITGVLTVSGNIVSSGSNGVANIGSATTFFDTVHAKATSAQYADLAENYVADAAYAPGTVLSFGGEHEVTLSTVEFDRRIAGVVSTNPSYIMNSTLEGEFVVTVALTGRVPTFVSGAIAKGDMMVSDGNGRAVACATPVLGTIIGKALENHPGGNGVIEVVVGRL